MHAVSFWVPMTERPTKTRIYCSDFRFHRLGRPFSHALTFIHTFPRFPRKPYCHFTFIVCVAALQLHKKHIPRIRVTAGSAWRGTHTQMLVGLTLTCYFYYVRVLWMGACNVRGADRPVVGLLWTNKWLDFVCETNVFETMGTYFIEGVNSSKFSYICSWCWCEFHALFNYSLLSSLCVLSTVFAHNGSNAPVSHINSIKCLRAHSMNACRQRMRRYSHSHEFRSGIVRFQLFGKRSI